MSYKDTITASFNQALIKKLRKETKSASKSEMRLQTSNAEFTRKRRHAEDLALAKELGVTIKELVE
tara:strand:- start:32 stop:229 length:198 start_codon:yes stop_codon:yes gene_type:complete